ncbi:UNVERIFIED_CONTAM: hypothetical protein Sradi_6007700 [Sesamum radiatum]|uniref:Uncharacterized protein n=1 Tax=Sesamum radiatum TaxID=300843 RepID=A0AAW2KI10_SESRA
MFQPNMFESHHHLLDMGHKTPENEMDLIRDDEYESKSGTDIMEAPLVMIKILISAPRRSVTIATHSIKSRKWNRSLMNALTLMTNKGRSWAVG